MQFRGQHIIIVLDNAGGIDASVKDKLFEPYVTTKASHDGIGLYISKTIIEQEMKASLKAESNSKMTQFIITFSKE